MAHPFIDEIQNIVDIGASSVSAHKVEMSKLQSYVNDLRSQEQAFYKQINFNGQTISSAAELNQLIQNIDKQMSIGTLLPRGQIESLLSSKYILTDNSKNILSNQQRQVIIATINQLIKEGMSYINKQVTSSRAIATKLSDLKNRLIAAIQMGISHHTTITDKKAIVDPITIDPFLLEHEALDYAQLNIKTSSIRGSQNVRDFDYKLDDNNLITELAIYTEGTNKFIPLGNMSDELANYLLSIAKDVLTEEGYNAIMTEQSVIIEPGSPIPIGSADPNKLKQDTINCIKSIVPSQYSAAIDMFAEQIAIGRSLSNIRGFLGEMRASLLMYTLFGESAAAQLVSTGLRDKIRMSPDGALQEAPIDFVVKALNEIYGFQVKNTVDTSYTWEGEMSAASFYLQRLQVSMSAGEQNFYGAFSYNQPLDNSEVHGDWADWDLYRRTIYPSFKSTFESVFAPVFKNLAPNIIRLSTQTGGDNVGIFEGTNALTNNFFIMQDKIIAASDIVQALIDDKNIRTKFGMTAGTNNTWYYGKSPTINYNANETKIDYSVTLNYKTLFKSAYNMS